MLSTMQSYLHQQLQHQFLVLPFLSGQGPKVLTGTTQDLLDSLFTSCQDLEPGFVHILGEATAVTDGTPHKRTVWRQTWKRSWAKCASHLKR